MEIFKKKETPVVEEPKEVKETKDEGKDDNDKKLIIQALMEDPEVKAYLAVVRGGEKFRIAAELEKE